MKKLFAVLAGLVILATSTFTPVMASEDDEVVRIAFQVSDDNPGTFQKVMNNVSNLSKNLLEAGTEYEIEVVAYNKGLNLFRNGVSSEEERVASFPNAIPNLTFSACGNTVKLMAKKTGKDITLIDGVRVVPAGVVRLYQLDKDGYFVIRP